MPSGRSRRSRTRPLVRSRSCSCATTVPDEAQPSASRRRRTVGQAHLYRLRVPDPGRKQRRHPAAGHDPDRRVRVREAGALGPDQAVTLERELESAVMAGPLTAPITGLSILGQNCDCAARLACPTRRRQVPTRRTQLLQVEAGAERGIGAGHDHDVDLLVVPEVADPSRRSRPASPNSGRCAPGRLSVTMATPPPTSASTCSLTWRRYPTSPARPLSAEST